MFGQNYGMNKFDRTVSILLLLQTKKTVTAQELANKFEVSLRTIYRDLRTLESAGIPIYAEAGVGYSLAHGYHLPPVLFSKAEALSFLVAEKIVEKMTSSDTANDFSNAVNKIKAVLKDADKDSFNRLTDHIHVAERLSSQVSFGEHFLQEILGAIDRKEQLNIEYHAVYSKSQKTVRRIEPLGLQFYSSYWHLIAFCELRQGYRDFRIDRIKKLESTGDSFVFNHPNLSDYMEKTAAEKQLIPVEVVFTKKAGEYARTQKYFYGFTHETETEQNITMHFLASSLEGMAHWLLIFIDKIEINYPQTLIDLMKELSKRLAENYKKY